jgi:hypothetical protein
VVWEAPAPDIAVVAWSPVRRDAFGGAEARLAVRLVELDVVGGCRLYAVAALHVGPAQRGFGVLARFVVTAILEIRLAIDTVKERDQALDRLLGLFPGPGDRPDRAVGLLVVVEVALGLAGERDAARDRFRTSLRHGGPSMFVGQARLGASTPGRAAFVTTCMLDECQHQHYTQHMPRVQTHLFQMRVSQPFLKKVDDWRRVQPDLPARAEAIRRLVDKALAVPAAKAPLAPVAKAAGTRKPA